MFFKHEMFPVRWWNPPPPHGSLACMQVGRFISFTQEGGGGVVSTPAIMAVLKFWEIGIARQNKKSHFIVFKLKNI